MRRCMRWQMSRDHAPNEVEIGKILKLDRLCFRTFLWVIHDQKSNSSLTFLMHNIYRSYKNAKLEYCHSLLIFKFRVLLIIGLLVTGNVPIFCFAWGLDLHHQSLCSTTEKSLVKWVHGLIEDVYFQRPLKNLLLRWFFSESLREMIGLNHSRMNQNVRIEKLPVDLRG